MHLCHKLSFGINQAWNQRQAGLIQPYYTPIEQPLTTPIGLRSKIVVKTG
jgi:hypothetical protein